MLCRIFIITLGILAAILPRSVAAATSETPAEKPLAVQHLRVDLKTGRVETVLSSVSSFWGKRRNHGFRR